MTSEKKEVKEMLKSFLPPCDSKWSGRLDSNQRPLEPHSSALSQAALRPEKETPALIIGDVIISNNSYSSSVFAHSS
jgi:hypothetical protein